MGCDSCTEQIGTSIVGSRKWLEGLGLDFSSGDQILPMDQWLDCRDWLDLFGLVEFTGSGGSSLTVTLQTCPTVSTDDAAWSTVTSCTGTMANGVLSWQAPDRVATPIMGVLRLKFSASGAVDGVLRVVVEFKRTA